jgi:hypothetical protein
MRAWSVWGTVAVGASLILIASVTIASQPAWAVHPITESSVEYAVTYEVSPSETQTVRPVKLVDVVTLGSQQFLVVEVRAGLSTSVSGFIDLDRRAGHPARLPRRLHGGARAETGSTHPPSLRPTVARRFLHMTLRRAGKGRQRTRRAPITVTRLVHTCLAAPSQWEGRTHDGRPIYVRYRWSKKWPKAAW